MSMSVLERRLQILVDHDRYAMLEREAQQQDVSVAAIVRSAIDAHLDDVQRRRATAGRRLLAQPLPDGPECEWDDLRAAYEDDRLRAAP
jgi:hypothetical protein